jgi:secreted trypsin-like serine protease
VLNDGSDAAPVHASLLNTPSRSSPAFLGPERTASATDPENDAEVARTSLALAKGYADGIYGPEVWQGDQTWKGGWESYQEVVAIRPAKGDGEKGKWCCSGVLIAKNAVLTADHCFFRECLDEASREGRGNGIVVYFGRGGDTQGKTYNVKKFIRYNGLPIQDARSDLAVLILERDVTDIAPVVIAQNGELDEAKDVVVAGFGIFDDSGKGGERRFARVSRGSPACAGPDDPKNFGCSKGTEFVAAMPLGTQPRQRFDTCDGDSGGPAYVQGPGREDKRLLVGITSRGVRGSISGVCGRGGVYTRLDREEYKQWITGIQEIRW